MRTIFISSFNPFISRNILLTDVFRLIKKRSDVHTIIFVPDYKVGYFRKHFGSPGVIIEGINVNVTSRQDVLFSYLASSLLNTRTLRLHKKEKFFKDRKLSRFLVSWLLMRLFSRFVIAKRFVRWLDLRILSANYFRGYFKKYKPDLVFATDVFNNHDVHLLAAAKTLGVFSVGMIRSWDNITTKGLFRVRSDRLIVHNEIIKKEVIKYENITGKDIFLSGIPQFDQYIMGKRRHRQEFFSKIGLDSKKKLILVSPFGKRFTPYDWQVLEILKRARENGDIPRNIQFLVRLPPQDEVDLGKFRPNELFFVDRPGHQFKKGVFRDTELDSDDMEWLADSLYHCDLIVSGGATLLIDGAIFDKPAILLYLDGWENPPYLKSVKRFLEYDHGLLLRESKGVSVVTTEKELIVSVNDYIVNPKRKSRERHAMAHEHCWRLDGRAGERIAKFILRESRS